MDANGNPELGRVFVFDYDSKSYPTSPMIQRAADCFREVAPDHTDDLLAPDAIEAFFRLHYWQQGGDDGRGWDQGAERQSIMACFRPDRNVLLHAQFRTAAAAYRLIDDAQTQVLVPYGKRGKKLISLLQRLPESPAPASPARLRPRGATLHGRRLRARPQNPARTRGDLGAHERYYLVNRDAYDEKLGLTFEALGPDAERLVV